MKYPFQPIKAHEEIQKDKEGLRRLQNVLLKCKETLESKKLYLPSAAEYPLHLLSNFEEVSVNALTRLLFLGHPSLPSEEITDIKREAITILAKAFNLSVESRTILSAEGKWDCHLSSRMDYFIPQMAKNNLFNGLKDGGDVLFLAGGIGEEALELSYTLDGADKLRLWILEKDPRCALACQLRGFSLLSGRTVDLDEFWSEKIRSSMDYVFLAFPDDSLNFNHISIQTDASLKAGGHFILVGSLDFTGRMTDQFLSSADYSKIDNPLKTDGVPISDEFLQIFKKIK